MTGPILAIPQHVHEVVLRWQLAGKRYQLDPWHTWRPLRTANGIHERAWRWRGWQSTIWGQHDQGSDPQGR